MAQSMNIERDMQGYIVNNTTTPTKPPYLIIVIVFGAILFLIWKLSKN